MIDLQKQRLRAVMRGLAVAHESDSSPVDPEMLAGLPPFRKAVSILLFSPLPGEPDPLPLMRFLPDRQFLFPRLEGETLGLFRYAPGSVWSAGPYGLREPDPTTWARMAPDSIDLALIPGLAFDALGGRLGRGKGYYDRLLGDSAFRGLKVGICREWQLVRTVPMEDHDIRMDLVVADGKIHDPGRLLDIPDERE